MATSWKSQQGDGTYRLQFETDDVEKYKLVEKASQMAVDGKTTADVVEIQTIRTKIIDLYNSKKVLEMDKVDRFNYRKGLSAVIDMLDKMKGKIHNG